MTKKKLQAEPAPPCANCGQPATVKETNRGAQRDVFCDYCAGKAYPSGIGLERL